MSINDYIQRLKENSCYHKEISSMTIEELEIEVKRLSDLKSTYDSWGSAQSINTDRYYEALRILEEKQNE